MIQRFLQELAGAVSLVAVTGVLVVVFFLPTLGLAWWLARSRRRFKAEMLDPFTTLPLRPPGESQRLCIEELKEKLDESLIQLLLAAMVSGLVVVMSRQINWSLIGFALVVTLGSFAWLAPKIVRTLNELRNRELGFMGERVVGEELNQLIRLGFEVFHDVPFEKFNADHVLVGPPGVYVVETKAKRKDARIKGFARATVVYDGQRLKFPTGTDTTFLQQVRLTAKSVAQWLSSATGEPVQVTPILTFPGWTVKRSGWGDVNVLRPDEIKRSFPLHPESVLSADQIKRISHQLSERCRLSRVA